MLLLLGKYKNILIIIAIVIVIIAIVIIYRNRKNKNETITSVSKDAVNSISNAETAKASITDTQAKFCADQLLTAMNGIGTDTKAITSVMGQLKNADDFAKVLKAFGVKKYYVNGLADGFLTRYMGDDLTLLGWFQNELDSKEYANIKKIVNGIGSKLM